MWNLMWYQEMEKIHEKYNLGTKKQNQKKKKVWPVTSFGLLKRQCEIEIHQEKEKENETDTTDNSINIISYWINLTLWNV